LECGGSTPLSFFAFPGRRVGLHEKRKKERKRRRAAALQGGAPLHVPVSFF
jgi:hypothetical protein